jgi:hypothetical protein
MTGLIDGVRPNVNHLSNPYHPQHAELERITFQRRYLWEKSAETEA